MDGGSTPTEGGAGRRVNRECLETERHKAGTYRDEPGAGAVCWWRGIGGGGEVVRREAGVRDPLDEEADGSSRRSSWVVTRATGGRAEGHGRNRTQVNARVVERADRARAGGRTATSTEPRAR